MLRPTGRRSLSLPGVPQPWAGGRQGASLLSDFGLSGGRIGVAVRTTEGGFLGFRERGGAPCPQRLGSPLAWQHFGRGRGKRQPHGKNGTSKQVTEAGYRVRSCLVGVGTGLPIPCCAFRGDLNPGPGAAACH